MFRCAQHDSYLRSDGRLLMRIVVQRASRIPINSSLSYEPHETPPPPHRRPIPHPPHPRAGTATIAVDFNEMNGVGEVENAQTVASSIIGHLEVFSLNGHTLWIPRNSSNQF